MTATSELEPAEPPRPGAGHGARPWHCDAGRVAAVVGHRVRCARAAPLACRPSSGAGGSAPGWRGGGGLARRVRAHALARRALYITGIMAGVSGGSVRPQRKRSGPGNNRLLCKVHKQARAVTARNRCASPAPAQSVKRRRGWLGPWHRRPWTSIRPNSAATDQEHRAEITDGRERDEFTDLISKCHHIDIFLIFNRYRTYSHSSPAPAYAWERGRVPGGGGRGRRSSRRGVKVQAARRQAIGRREGRPGRSRGGRLAGRA